MPSAGTTCKVESRAHFCRPSLPTLLCLHTQGNALGGKSVGFCMAVQVCQCGCGCAPCPPTDPPCILLLPSDDQDLLAAKPVTEKLPPHERRMGSLTAHMAFPRPPFLPPHGPAHLRGPPERFMVPAAPFMGPPGAEFLRLPPRGEVTPLEIASCVTCCCQSQAQ